MKKMMIAIAALAALFLLPGCKHGDAPHGHTHRVRAGRPSPVLHHHVHAQPPAPPAGRP